MSTKLRTLLVVYLLLLGASHAVRLLSPQPDPARPPIQQPGHAVLQAAAVDGSEVLPRQRVRQAYRYWRAEESPTEAKESAARPTVLLIHGSPGAASNFDGMVPDLRRRYDVLVPDLPGFGDSQLDIPDYSFRAHARYCLQLLDDLGIEQVHAVGFSMGGGVVLELAEQRPDAIASLTMLAAIGVQEMELLGNYQLNHVVHGLQVGFLWFLREGVPHFGVWDGAFFGVPYARNFYDSDQRPLRGYLQRFDKPMLIVHGRGDVLVPVGAALEHARLVPQSELQLLDRNHFFVFSEGPQLAAMFEAFFQRVDAGEVATRATASSERLERAAAPFRPQDLPPLDGFALTMLLFVIAVSTLVSEDLTCIATGLLVAAGRIPFLPGTAACFAGIFIGDMLLYAAGRFLGRPALGRAPLKWMLRPQDVERSSQWFESKGSAVIIASRFIPGTRLPTYFAAGLFKTHALRFTFYFLLACLVWTPVLVALAMWLGSEAWQYFELFEEYAWVAVVGLILVILIGTRILVPAATWRGRRLLRGSLQRKLRWEYWPIWVFYPPLVLWILWLGIRFRSFTLFTAANPGIPAGGGMVGESKSMILQGLCGGAGASQPPELARFDVLPAAESADARVEQLDAFLRQIDSAYPVVLKPDTGERGAGVQVVASRQQATDYLTAESGPVIAQEYIPGREFGVFYMRLPQEEKGFIFSITDKRLPSIVGDGKRTVEELILADKALLAMARYYLRVQESRVDEVLPAGEELTLVQLGTHCRGAVFLKGSHLITPELEAAIERVSQRFEGFYFGRYDVRTPSEEDLRQGRFRVLELNGITSESTDIYDPRNSLLHAYKVLFRQWRYAFEIGRQNRELGVEAMSLWAFLGMAGRNFLGR